MEILDIVLVAFLAVFSVGAVMLLACGNKGGNKGAVITGIVGGLLVAIPALRDHMWIAASLTVCCGMVGAFIGTYLPETHRIKRFMREQTNLRITCGKYFSLGRAK